MVDSLVQPFKRTIPVPPIIGPVGAVPIAVRVPPMTTRGVTSFILSNPNPFYIWFAGWKGEANEMPEVKGNGHYLHPGEKYLGRTQMPDFVAAVADDEPGFPILTSGGAWAYEGKRTRFVLIYGSGI